MFAQRFIAGYFTFRLLKDRLGQASWHRCAPGVCMRLRTDRPSTRPGPASLCTTGSPLPAFRCSCGGSTTSAGWSFGRRLAVAAGLGLLLGFTSHYFFAVFVVAAVVLWLFVRRRTSAGGPMLVVILFALAWAVTEAPAVWGSLLNAAQSHRADWALQAMSLGAPPCPVSTRSCAAFCSTTSLWSRRALGFAATRFRIAPFSFALGSSAAILLVVTRFRPLADRAPAHAGPLAGFQVDRFYLLAPFALIVSGALGLDALAAKLRARLPSDGGRRGRMWAASLTLLVLLVLGPLASARVQVRILREMHAGSTFAAVFQRPELQRLAAGVGRSLPIGWPLSTRRRSSHRRGTPCGLAGRPVAGLCLGIRSRDRGRIRPHVSEALPALLGVVSPNRALRQDKAMSDYFLIGGVASISSSPHRHALRR